MFQTRRTIHMATAIVMMTTTVCSVLISGKQHLYIDQVCAVDIVNKICARLRNMLSRYVLLL